MARFVPLETGEPIGVVALSGPVDAERLERGLERVRRWVADGTLPGIEQSVRLDIEAKNLLDEGKAANQQSDDYVLNTVILVSVLFFAGIAQRRFRRLEYRVALTILGSGMLVYGLVNIFRYPVH